MKKVIYKEKQKYNDLVVYMLLGIFLTVIIGQIFMAVYTGKFSIVFISISLGSLAILLFELWYLLKAKLVVSVNSEFIKVKKSPFPRTKEKIYWKDIVSCKVVRSRPAGKWSGNNVHFGRLHFHSFNGRNGLSIVTRDGSEYFIGFKNIDKLISCIEQVNLKST